MFASIKSFCCCLVVTISFVTANAQTHAPHRGPAETSHKRVFDVVFHSASLDRDMHYRLLLPADYGNGDRFPVLYLLHGLYGDYKNWDTRTHLEKYAKGLSLLIVMPDAGDSWYTNSATVPADKFEDYVTKDLVSEIDGKYRTIPQRNSRAIAGLSMGGYAAVKLGIRYPNQFAFAGSLSGALNAAGDLDTLRPDFRTKLLAVFGNAGSSTRENNDVFKLLQPSVAGSLPYFYLGCGTGDFLLDVNRAFIAQLSAGKIGYEYHETPGAHEWPYWDRALLPMLGSLVMVLKANPPGHP